MDSWSKRRKLIYALILLVIVAVVVGIPLFVIFYKAPTCFDGKQNGSEQGVDCGGKCTKLCQNEFLPPSVAWSRIESVVPGVYNAAAYIINPNNTGEAKNVPYHMELYDRDGMLIIEKKGTVTIPPHRNTLAFSSLIKVDKSIPTKVLFEFTSLPDWNKKADTLDPLVVVSKEYKEEGNTSSLLVSLRNDGLKILNNIGIYVVLYDKSGNAIGFSKTVLDSIMPKATSLAPFTWNTNRQGEVVSIEVLYVAE
jgi:hypothetical protein